MIEGGIPLFGTINVLVNRVTTASIHGDIYYDLVVRILPLPKQGEDEEEMASDDNANNDDDDAVKVGDWKVRQPGYQVRLPNHLCLNRVPMVGDCLTIMFIAQQASSVEFLS